jgi:hypothetical protein
MLEPSALSGKADFFGKLTTRNEHDKVMRNLDWMCGLAAWPNSLDLQVDMMGSVDAGAFKNEKILTCWRSKPTAHVREEGELARLQSGTKDFVEVICDVCHGL